MDPAGGRWIISRILACAAPAPRDTKQHQDSPKQHQHGSCSVPHARRRGLGSGDVTPSAYFSLDGLAGGRMRR